MDRSKMARRATCRWMVANLEPSKSSNIDFLDLIDKFNDHANSELAGLQISNSRLVSYLEETFRTAKFDGETNRIHGVSWRKPKEVVHEPRPSKSPEDQAMETRLLAFLNDGNVGVARGEKGFTASSFAGWRQSWLMSGGARIVHDRIDPKEAQTFLEKSGLVRWDDENKLWFVKA